MPNRDCCRNVATFACSGPEAGQLRRAKMIKRTGCNGDKGQTGDTNDNYHNTGA